MPIAFQPLGFPARDNALLVRVDIGQAVSRLLFDCGEGCLSDVPVRDIQAIECLCLSHFHIDHIGGFDAFFRHNFSRPDPPIRVFGPANSIEIMHHRLSGVTWNLVEDTPGEYHVTAISEEQLTTAVLKTREAFAQIHLLPPQTWSRCVFHGVGYDLEAMVLDHGTPSIAYLIREHRHLHVDQDRMRQHNLEDGPWLRFLKDPAADDAMQLDIHNRSWSLGELRQRLLTETPGDSIAYLTDFCLDAAAEERVVDWLRDCQTVVCENNFRNADRSLAQRSRHMVSADVGRIAARAGIGELILIHVSDRYQPHEHRRQLDEVRAAFPRARFPDHWHSFREA